MPGGSLFALLDDISFILDDVWVMTKLSAKKTSGVLGDDLALNAQQAVGLRPERELPVIFAVAKGSAKNKCFLVPLAILLRSVAPWLVQPLLMFGGLFLCFEGVEKLIHKPSHSHDDPGAEMSEEDKIAGAVRTDLILSAEIIALTLGMVTHMDLTRVILVLVTISILMTIGVYGLVACIVKLDDLGFMLQDSPSAWKQKLGRGILAAAPRLLSAISWIGTIAVFCVGGGILAHGIGPIHHFTEKLSAPLALVAEAGVGLVSGFLAVGVVKAFLALKSRIKGA